MMSPEFSLAICTHNEKEYIKPLLEQVTRFVRVIRGASWEIVILDDSDDPETIDLLDSFANSIVLHRSHQLNGDFAAHKNHLNGLCKGRWIMQLDGDEYVSLDMLELIPHLIDANPDVEAYGIARINTVEGLTLKHIQQWHWTISQLPGFTKIKVLEPESEEYKLLKMFNLIIKEEQGCVTFHEPIVAYPDLQYRLYRNSPAIHWERNVHEHLTGYKTLSIWQDPAMAIQHHKQIIRQEKQNALYATLANS